MKTILGVKGWDLSEYAISANAILGIRDSGKTYTGTEAAEELFDAGVPFIAFDPIGVWHSLRIPGKGKGYPVVVAGGKHADLPLTRKNAGAIVRAAMSAEVSLVLDLFSIELSKADWKAIVRECVEILLHENSEHGLRHVFIEEAAEFVPQRVIDGQVFAAVEKLVRMGGNSKLGCTLINQRSADLNKSVLELCGNVFVHRQTGKNTMLDLKKWFEMLALDKDEQARIASSLPDLKSGECWAFINDLKKPIRLKVPEKNSQHPDRRAVIAKGEVKRQPVPADKFVAQMTAKLAGKDKPQPKPPAAIAFASLPPSKSAKQIKDELASARADGFQEGYLAGHRHGFRDGRITQRGLTIQLSADIREKARELVSAHAEGSDKALYTPPAIMGGTTASRKVPQSTFTPPSAAPTRSRTPAAPRSAAAPLPDGLTGPQARIMQSLAFWASIGHETPSREQVGGVAGYSATSGSFRNTLSSLNVAGLIALPSAGRVELTGTYDAMGADEAKQKLTSIFGGPERKIVDALLDAPGPITREELGATVGYEPTSGSFRNTISSLNVLGVITKPSVGQVQISDWAREVLADG